MLMVMLRGAEARPKRDAFGDGTYQSLGCPADVGWTSLSIAGTSTARCALNVVSVRIIPDIAVPASCAGYIELSGLDGVSIPEDLQTWGSEELLGGASWGLDGNVQVRLAGDLVAGTPYFFRFRVR